MLQANTCACRFGEHAEDVVAVQNQEKPSNSPSASLPMASRLNGIPTPCGHYIRFED